MLHGSNKRSARYLAVSHSVGGRARQPCLRNLQKSQYIITNTFILNLRL